MTSSLVGSEMCIRDRGKPAGDREASKPTHKARGGCRGAPARAAMAPSGDCLLYTSDAADDM
eukprot:8926724-Prorocentrum_lima.AAC.1